MGGAESGQARPARHGGDAMTEKIQRLIDDIVSCADEADGGQDDARAYCEQLVAALSTPAQVDSMDRSLYDRVLEIMAEHGLCDGGHVDTDALKHRLEDHAVWKRVVSAAPPAAPPADLVAHDPPMGFCQWLDEGSDYTTECGHGWQFMDGGVEQNDAKFCLFCGGRITLVPLPEVPDGK